MHAKITNMLEKLTKIVPEWPHNLSKIDPGGALEATWEPPLKQGASKTSFFTIFASFWDPLWDHVGLILGIIFLMFFWSGFLMALASIWAPKTPPKWDPKGCQRHILSKSENRALAYTRARSRGVWGTENHHFFDVFLEPCFGMVFGTHFCDFGSLLGSLLETILVTFWVPFLHRFLDPLKTSKKWCSVLLRPPSTGHCLPPPRTPPP